jgi:hypothetical protein
MYRGKVLLMAVLTASTALAAERDEAAIRKQIEQIKESDVNAWRKIPWTASLLAARRVAECEKRPIFLFTYDGNIETGRC